MDPGHGEVALALSRAPESETDYWRRIYGAPLPKLCGFFNLAGAVDGSIEERGGNCFWSRKARDNPYDDHYPVPTAAFNLSVACDHAPDTVVSADHGTRMNMLAQEAESCKVILEDLHKLGVPAYRRIHSAIAGGGRISYRY
jgi:hypothetical protein